MIFSEYDFKYLLPPKEVFKVHHEDYYIQHMENGVSVRKIFHNVPYQDFEKEKLIEFKEIIKREGLEIPKWWNDGHLVKYMYSAKFAFEKCIENLKGHLEWLKQPARERVSEQSIEILRKGLIYVAGRDKQFRPVIVIRVDRIDMKNLKQEDFVDAMSFLLSCIVGYYFVPGKVENWITVIEAKDVGVWSFPFKMIQQLIGAMAKGFTSTLHKMYITNPPMIVKASWALIKNLTHPETAAKMAMVDSSNFDTMLENIPIDQLEERYGGHLKDPEVYWPPRNTLNMPCYMKGEFDAYMNLFKEGAGSEDETIVSQGDDTYLGANEPKEIKQKPLVPSIYFDFDEIHPDLPSTRTNLQWMEGRGENKESFEMMIYRRNMEMNHATGMNIDENVTKGRGVNVTLNDDIIYEKKGYGSGCCGPSRSGKSEGGCNIF